MTESGLGIVLEARQLVKDVRNGAQTLRLLNNVSLEVQAGEWVALMGPSGSGKSTLLHVLGALDTQYTGSVRLAGELIGDLSDAGRAALRRSALGFVFQSYNLVGHLSALQNVLLPAYFAAGRADVSRGETLLQQVGLADKLHQLPGLLSGGERQRVAIARALYARPAVVLCDEPTGSLDGQTGAHILALFKQVQTAGAALVMATHDPAVARCAKRVLQVQAGTLHALPPERP